MTPMMSLSSSWMRGPKQRAEHLRIVEIPGHCSWFGVLELSRHSMSPNARVPEIKVTDGRSGAPLFARAFLSDERAGLWCSSFFIRDGSASASL